MKKIILPNLLFFEEFIKAPISRSFKKSNSVNILWEKVSQKTFRLGSYLKSISNDGIAKALDAEIGYYRVLIYNDHPNFLIFIWNAEVLHSDIASSLSKIVGLSHIKYNKEYENSLGGVFGNQWCFPIVYDGGKMRSNITKERLIKFNHEKSISSLLKISDDQWQFFLDEAF